MTCKKLTFTFEYSGYTLFVMVAAINEVNQRFVQFGSDAFAKVLIYSANFPDVLDEVLDEAILCFREYESMQLLILAHDEKAFASLPRLRVHTDKLLESVSTLKSSPDLRKRKYIFAKLAELEEVALALAENERKIEARLDKILDRKKPKRSAMETLKSAKSGQYRIIGPRSGSSGDGPTIKGKRFPAKPRRGKITLSSSEKQSKEKGDKAKGILEMGKQERSKMYAEMGKRQDDSKTVLIGQVAAEDFLDESW